MRPIILGLGLLVSALSGTAGATEFTCEVPWYSLGRDCTMPMFAVRPGETVTIKVTKITDKEGNDADGAPEFEIVDQNRDRTLDTFSVSIGNKEGKSWMNKNDKELIVRFSAKIRFLGTKIIHGTYTVTRK